MPTPRSRFAKKFVPEPGDLRDKDLVRDLRHHPRAISRLCVRVDCAAVCEAAKRLQSITKHLIRPLTVDLRDETYTARVMF
jgi:hypothetical protein